MYHRCRTSTSMMKRKTLLSSCARVRTCVIISDPLSIRASFVVASERLSKVGYISSQVSLGQPYRVDTTKAGQRQVFDCASRVLQSSWPEARCTRLHCPTSNRMIFSLRTSLLLFCFSLSLFLFLLEPGKLRKFGITQRFSRHHQWLMRNPYKRMYKIIQGYENDLHI